MVSKGAIFKFIVKLTATSNFPEKLENKWKQLLEKAFKYAFEEVGFGAKTNIGYGFMEEIENFEEETEEIGASLSPIQKKIKELKELPKNIATYDQLFGDLWNVFNTSEND